MYVYLTSTDEIKWENNSRRGRRLRENRINLYNIREVYGCGIKCLRTHPRAIAYVDLSSGLSFGKRRGKRKSRYKTRKYAAS